MRDQLQSLPPIVSSFLLSVSKSDQTVLCVQTTPFSIIHEAHLDQLLADLHDTCINRNVYQHLEWLLPIQRSVVPLALHLTEATHVPCFFLSCPYHANTSSSTECCHVRSWIMHHVVIHHVSYHMPCSSIHIVNCKSCSSSSRIKGTLAFWGLFLGLYPLLPETPYWLVLNGDLAGADAVLQRMAKINGVHLPQVTPCDMCMWRQAGQCSTGLLQSYRHHSPRPKGLAALT